MSTIEAVPMSRQARMAYATVGVFLLAFFGGMSMVLTP